MKKVITLFLVYFAFTAQSQDTLKILQYNLLNYGNYTTYCTTDNNNHETKDAWIRTIIEYELPDIFTVNELSSYEFYHTRILNNVLNTNGRTFYRKANVANIAASYLVNMLFYNSNKLELKSYEVVQSTTRDIDLFTLYYKSATLAQGDTIFIHCLVAHLKAGNTAADATSRAVMTANMISYLQSNKEPGNYLFMGDLNTYTSNELCYQQVTDVTATDFRFFDPVNKPGNWNNSSSFAAWHTQSVTTSSNGCQSSGGMDDRFDHILATAQIINGSMGLKYIGDTYHAMGQDGQHFNKSITDSPTNNSVPAEVLTALYNNSDHLPVKLKLEVNAGSAGGINSEVIFRNAGIYLVNQDVAHLFVTSEKDLEVKVSVISLTGQLVISENMNLNRGRNEVPLDIRNLRKGVYVIRIADSRGRMASIKLVK